MAIWGFLSRNWLKIWTCSLLRLICIHFISLLTKFHQDLSSSCRYIDRRSFKKVMKIGRFLGKITPWRRNAMKKWMTAVWKEIYRRFWISNQIFDSIYGSRDIAHSLDTTFGNSGQNLNFVDDYLKNGKRFWHAVFARCSELISSTFWASFIKIVRAIFEKQSKNCHFDHIFGLFGWSKIFLDNPASSLFSFYHCLTSCKVSWKSLEPFLRKMIN